MFTKLIGLDAALNNFNLFKHYLALLHLTGQPILKNVF